MAYITMQLRALYSDVEGGTMVEYAMIAACIAAVCAVAVAAFGKTTNNLYLDDARRIQ